MFATKKSSAKKDKAQKASSKKVDFDKQATASQPIVEESVIDKTATPSSVDEGAAATPFDPAVTTPEPDTATAETEP